MTAPYAHIGCCIDDSEAARLAVDEAVRLRDLGPGRLSLVFAAPQPLVYAGVSGEWIPDPADIAAGAERWLADRAAQVPGADPVLLNGYPPVAVCDWAAGSGCDLLIAAAHRGRVERMLLGSFASYLAYHAPCPVLLVRPPAGGGEAT
jgi:nucleotide-binding universal stress UspA family protein